MAWHMPRDGRRSSGSRGRSRCASTSCHSRCAPPCCQAHSRDSPARSCSGSRNVSGPLGLVILPGQVLSPSPTRCANATGVRSAGIASRYSPGRGPRHGAAARCGDACDGLPGHDRAAVDEKGSAILAGSSGGAVSSSAPVTIDLAAPDVHSVPDAMVETEERPDSAVSPCHGSTAQGIQIEEHLTPPHRGRRKRRDGSGMKEPIYADRGAALQGDDIDRLIARCMTHERPAALVQASAALLEACLRKLGQEAPLGEKRSDRIRRMLQLTDELRRYNADLTEQGVSTKAISPRAHENSGAISMSCEKIGG